MMLWLVVISMFLWVIEIRSASNIRMQRDFFYPTVEDFPVYWNVPTFMCHKHGINFGQHTRKFGITANNGDEFRGDYINILYDPGLFPAMLQTSKGRTVERNGGIPQLGNLTRHLDSFRNVIEQLIPPNFNGAGIIDFEAWRPVFRQNWNQQSIYKDMSRNLERQKHPQWNEDKIENQAKKNFEMTSKVFMETTLKLVKLLRPKAKWGYYAFPYCFNYRSNSNMEPWCHKDVEKENDRVQWMFEESTALYPSLYMSKSLNEEDHRKFVIGRLNEAWRVASKVSSHKIPVVNPYIWYKYYDSSDFLAENDIYNALETTRKYKMGGAVIWGATNDVITKDLCLRLLNYLNTTLGPTVSRVRRENQKRVNHAEITFVPLVLTSANNTDSSNTLNFSYKVVPRYERSTTTEAPPPLGAGKWYQRLLRAIFRV